MSDNSLNTDVKVQPRSSRREIGRVEQGRLKIGTTAAPTTGKANREFSRLLAKAFGVPPSRVSLLRGATSRLKTFRIESPQLVPDRVGELYFS